MDPVQRLAEVLVLAFFAVIIPLAMVGYLVGTYHPFGMLFDFHVMWNAGRDVAHGHRHLSPEVAEKLAEHVTFPALTDRELEVLQLIGEGKDSHTIAQQLNVSSKTVDAHRGNIKQKLKLKNATELVCYAARWVETLPQALA